MDAAFTNRQRTKLYEQKGCPILALEFDVFPSGEVSMWTHTPYAIAFDDMKRAFEAIQDHLSRFIADGNMCPFNPAFAEKKAELADKVGVA